MLFRSNHVDCIGLPRKMGLKGCANTHLVFGANGTTRGWLLGGRRNVGLLQLMQRIPSTWAWAAEPPHVFRADE